MLKPEAITPGPDMDFRKLEMFRAVARGGSLKKAAALVGRTVPAVSMQIKGLEEEIGIPLFRHLPTKLVLTEQGRLFLTELDAVFEALDRAKSVASLATPKSNGSITIALGSDLSTYFAPKIATFSRSYPDVRISLISGPTWRGLPLITEHEVDIGIGLYRGVPEGLTKVRIMGTGIMLVTPKDAALDRKSRPTLQWISRQRIITLSRAAETRRMIDAVFAGKGYTPRNLIDVSSCRSALEFVRLGLGVALVHQVCTCHENLRQTLRFDMKEEFGELEVSLVTRPDILTRPPHAAFIEAMTKP